MASNTGMAGLAVTAVVSALVAFGVAALLGPTAPAGSPASPAAGESAESLRREVDRLRREVQELRTARSSASPPGSVPGAPSSGAAAAGGPAAGGGGPSTAEGPVPATRAELQAFVDQRLAARLAEGVAPASAAAGADKVQRKTIDEAGAELGLSSVDIDSVKRVFHESEMDALALIAGTPDIEAVREEVRAAQEDPDKKAALISKFVGNMFRNLGRVATIEDRRNRELKKFLSDEQVRKLKGMNLKPTIEDEGIEGIMKGTFGD